MSVVLLLDLLTKPQLLVEVAKDKKVACFETGHHVYLRVVVTVHTLVHRLPAWLVLTYLVKYLMPMQPALRAEAKLIFLKENGCPKFYDKWGKIAVMQGRWARTAEPSYGPSERNANERTNTRPWVDKTSFVRYVDIPCGSSHELDVVMRRKMRRCGKKAVSNAMVGIIPIYL